VTGPGGRADALREIRAHHDATRSWVVVLDDDPTGCQAMYDATVLIDPTTDELARAASERRTTFVWTNTRSLPEADAVEVDRALVQSAVAAAELAGVRPVFVSRSDSTLRGPDAAEAEKVLLALRDGDVVVANAATATDLELLVLACQAAERAGRHLLYRTGPSLVRVLAGQPARAPLTAADLAGPAPAVLGYGLTVVGSHTALTTRQLDDAARHHPLSVVELDVEAVLDAERRAGVRQRIVEQLEEALQRGHAALVTSRAVRTAADDPHGSLAIARLVSDEVCAVVSRLSVDLPLSYVVAKGGITSHEVAARGLGMRRAAVLGQMFPGQVSVLRLGAETPRPGVPYVVYPGNVGHDDSLAQVLTTLTAAVRCDDGSGRP
jgi:uncharacterized protein YgbK (DUF1537 family)